jgi:hypothetical protein
MKAIGIMWHVQLLATWLADYLPAMDTCPQSRMGIRLSSGCCRGLQMHLRICSIRKLAQVGQ